MDFHSCSQSSAHQRVNRKYVLAFSAMDETPSYITGHQRILDQFVNKTRNVSHEKNELI